MLTGEGMLLVDKSFTWRGDVYKAGSTRVSPDHPVTESEFADCLKPAYDQDATVGVMRWLERRLAAQTTAYEPRQRGVARSKYIGAPYWRLAPIPGRERWRLG